jgi:hypothetical protein
MSDSGIAIRKRTSVRHVITYEAALAPGAAARRRAVRILIVEIASEAVDEAAAATQLQHKQ